MHLHTHTPPNRCLTLTQQAQGTMPTPLSQYKQEQHLQETDQKLLGSPAAQGHWVLLESSACSRTAPTLPPH
jgi:hypothetical protein